MADLNPASTDEVAVLAPLRRLARAAPADPAALGNLAIMLAKFGRLEEAEETVRKALSVAPANPINRLALGLILLSQGRYADAWPFYAARAEVAAASVSLPARLKPPRWSGEAISGKRLLIMPEQGLGDQIQFSRLLPALAAEGADITLASHAALHSLFRTSFPDITHIAPKRVTELPDADYWVSLIDLPAILNVAPATLAPPPYLRTATKWENPPPGFKIGLMAAGNPLYVNDAGRSLSSEMADRLRANLPGQVISLDPTITGAANFSETAAIVDAVDLVVSVDTAAGHLAGAMGKRCLLLVPGFNTDWRWMRTPDHSAWYPGHTLYRGSIQGDWSDAIDRLLRDAHALSRQDTWGAASLTSASAI